MPAVSIGSTVNTMPGTITVAARLTSTWSICGTAWKLPDAMPAIVSHYKNPGRERRTARPPRSPARQPRDGSPKCRRAALRSWWPPARRSPGELLDRERRRCVTVETVDKRSDIEADDVTARSATVGDAVDTMSFTDVQIDLV